MAASSKYQFRRCNGFRVENLPVRELLTNGVVLGIGTFFNPAASYVSGRPPMPHGRQEKYFFDGSSLSCSSGIFTFEASAGVAPIEFSICRSRFIPFTPTSSPAICLPSKIGRAHV